MKSGSTHSLVSNCLLFPLDLPQTHSGLFTVAINPYKLYPIYTDSVIKRYVNRRRNEVPPHVFSVGDEAYRQLLRDQTSQSMLVTYDLISYSHFIS